MLHHRPVYGDNCGVVSYEYCALFDAVGGLHILINQRWANCKIHQSISSLKRKCDFMLKSDIKSCPSVTDPFFPG